MVAAIALRRIGQLTAVPVLRMSSLQYPRTPDLRPLTSSH